MDLDALPEPIQSAMSLHWPRLTPADFTDTQRVLVTGARRWKSRMLPDVLLDLKILYGARLIVIHGDERSGIDAQAAVWCECYDVRCLAFPALWDAYKRARLNYKRAGTDRNEAMRVRTRPHAVLAFHYDLSVSKGTKDMVKRARRAGVPVQVFGE